MKTRLLPLIAAASFALQGCATINREPFTEAEQHDARIVGIPDARFWADTPDAGRKMAPAFVDERGDTNMLALSGGSDNGAYGAGLLNGWTKAGNRPEFSIVTGVSTGALIAPFAFLGADEDPTLKRIYTTVSAKDIFRPRFPLAIPFSPSAASTEPLTRLIASAVTDALVDRIGLEYGRGRRLFIGTANLDAQRMVIWNMGAIAASRAPSRYALFRQLLLASSSIPAVFPPVMIEANAAGRKISEMHVDGGTTAQILTLPDALITATGSPSRPSHLHVYLIVNNKLGGEFHLANTKTIPIASQAFSLNLRSSLAGTVNLSYLYAQAHGIDFNISYIAKNYPGDDRKTFDTAYMQGLFAHGLRLAQSGAFWDKRPPEPER
jgi:hypothetical protein